MLRRLNHWCEWVSRGHKKCQRYRPINDTWPMIFSIQGDIQGRISKNRFLAIKSCRNMLQHLVSTVELHFYRTQVSLGSDLWVRLSFTDSLTEEPCCRLNLSDEDTNSILTDNANRAIQDYLAMQLIQVIQAIYNCLLYTSPSPRD